MDRRPELHERLCDILGSRNVYFQPPESVKLKYPAIVYSRSTIDNTHADNLPYLQKIEYMVTVIDKDPDSEIVQRMSQVPYCRHNRHYKADNLNHDTFILYY